jgi:microcystin-dependent protein
VTGLLPDNFLFQINNHHFLTIKLKYMEPFLAEIKLFAGNFAPRGWYECNGATLSIAQNTALFSLLGTTFGGNGQNTFCLPDLRGRVPVGRGQGPGLSNRNQGDMGGVETVALISSQIAAHVHPLTAPTVTVTAATAAATADLSAYAGAADTVTAVNGCSLATVGAGGRGGDQYPTYSTSAPNIKLNAGSVTNLQNILPSVAVNMPPNTGAAGSNTPHENMTPFLGMIYIIAYEGVWPSRP